MSTKILITPQTDLASVRTGIEFTASEAYLESQWGIRLKDQNLVWTAQGSILPNDVISQILDLAYAESVSVQGFRVVDLRTDQRSWFHSLRLDQTAKIQYTVSQHEPVLAAHNIWWRAEMLSDKDLVIGSLRRCQRWYTE